MTIGIAQTVVTIVGLACKDEKIIWSTNECGDLISTPEIISQLVPGVDLDDLLELFPLTVEVKLDGQEVKDIQHSNQ